MTPAEIDQMEMGRDLDALVAEKVLRKKPCKFVMTGIISTLTTWKCKHRSPENCYPEDKGVCLEEYSEQISSAWKVVDAMRERGIYLARLTNGSRIYSVEFAKQISRSSLGDRSESWGAMAEFAPLAICRASLKASLA